MLTTSSVWQRNCCTSFLFSWLTYHCFQATWLQPHLSSTEWPLLFGRMIGKPAGCLKTDLHIGTSDILVKLGPAFHAVPAPGRVWWPVPPRGNGCPHIHTSLPSPVPQRSALIHRSEGQKQDQSSCDPGHTCWCKQISTIFDIKKNFFFPSQKMIFKTTQKKPGTKKVFCTFLIHRWPETLLEVLVFDCPQESLMKSFKGIFIELMPLSFKGDE